MSDVRVLGGPVERGAAILTAEALAFVGGLHEAFAARRDELLAARKVRRAEASRTGRLDFVAETTTPRARRSRWTPAESATNCAPT